MIMHAHTEANKMLKNHTPTNTISCSLKCRKLVAPSDCLWSPAIYERGHGLGFGYKWLACRVSLKGLYGSQLLTGSSYFRPIKLHYQFLVHKFLYFYVGGRSLFIIHCSVLWHFEGVVSWNRPNNQQKKRCGWHFKAIMKAEAVG